MKTDRNGRDHRRDRILAIEDGRVVCPRRGLADLESCWTCPAYAGLSATHREGVICRANLVDLSVGIVASVR
jgi:hypothetical protein